MWALSGGGIEFGETLERTSRRKIEEKTGLRNIQQPQLSYWLSQAETHPELDEAEMHLLGFLFRLELRGLVTVKSEPNEVRSLETH